MLNRDFHISSKLTMSFLVILASFLILMCLYFSTEKKNINLEGRQIKLVELYAKNGRVFVKFFDGKEKLFSITTPQSYFLNYEGNLNFTQVFSYNDKQYRGKWNRYEISPGYNIKILPEKDVIYELYAIPVWEVTTRIFLVDFVAIQEKYLKISIQKKNLEKEDPY